MITFLACDRGAYGFGEGGAGAVGEEPADQVVGGFAGLVGGEFGGVGGGGA